MKVSDLIERLRELPPDWEVEANKGGYTLTVYEPGPQVAGARFGYIPLDGEPTRLQTRRKDSPLQRWADQGEATG